MEQQVIFFLALAAGLVFGGLAVWVMLRADTASAYGRARAEYSAGMAQLQERLSGKETAIEELRKDRELFRAEVAKAREEAASLRAAQAELETKLAEGEKVSAERLSLLNDAREKLSDTFKALSAEALHTNNQAFIALATTAFERFHEGAQFEMESRQRAIDALVKPLRESLGKVDADIHEFEKGRAAQVAGISEQVRSLREMQDLLRAETANLVSALRVPAVRGRWGEMQLRRVAEMAGMLPHCDFEEQPSAGTDDGRLRPDMVVRLPNGRRVVVDAKVPLKAYLTAAEAPDEAGRRERLAEHAAQVRAHLKMLGSKNYWEQFSPAPEFVVAFLPGEALFGAALEQDPELIDYGVERRVLLATPTTLIALLKAVAYGWQQEKLAENAQEISRLGRSLYSRLRTFACHLERMGRALHHTVETYNSAVGSLETRVLAGARRFEELGASTREPLPLLEPVDSFPRSLRAVELAVSTATLEEPEPPAAGPADEEPASVPGGEGDLATAGFAEDELAPEPPQEPDAVTGECVVPDEEAVESQPEPELIPEPESELAGTAVAETAGEAEAPVSGEPAPAGDAEGYAPEETVEEPVEVAAGAPAEEPEPEPAQPSEPPAAPAPVAVAPKEQPAFSYLSFVKAF